MVALCRWPSGSVPSLTPFDHSQMMALIFPPSSPLTYSVKSSSFSSDIPRHQDSDSSRGLLAGGLVAQIRAHTNYQDISVLAGLLLSLLARSESYQPPHYKSVEDRAHLVVGHLHPLCQETLIDNGALQGARCSLPLLADDIAYLLSQLLLSHRLACSRTPTAALAASPLWTAALWSPDHPQCPGGALPSPASLAAPYERMLGAHP